MQLKTEKRIPSGDGTTQQHVYIANYDPEINFEAHTNIKYPAYLTDYRTIQCTQIGMKAYRTLIRFTE